MVRLVILATCSLVQGEGVGMGIRSKIKSKLKHKIEQLKTLAAVVHDEANHPGRPQPHMAARNPFWGGEEKTDRSKSSADKKDSNEAGSNTDDKHQLEAESPQDPQEETSSKKQPKGSLEEEEADFWFLKYGDNEGWNETNPGKKK